MKRTIAFVLVIAMVLAMLPAATLAAGEITVSTSTAFPTGCTVVASDFTFSDPDGAIAATDMTITSTVNTATPGAKKVEFVHTDGRKASYTIHVTAAADMIVVSLSSSGAARQAEGFYEDDTISVSDFNVAYYAKDKSESEIVPTDKYTIDKTKLVAGNNAVKITFGSLTDTYTIKDVKMGSKVTNEPELIIKGTAVTYPVGSVFDITTCGLSFYFRPRNTAGEKLLVPGTDTINVNFNSAFTSADVGTKKITFTYTDGTDTVSKSADVKVVSYLKSMEIVGGPLPFNAGDAFNPPAGALTATVYKWDGSVETSTTDMASDSSFSWSSETLKKGQNKVTVTYKDAVKNETVQADASVTITPKLTSLKHTSGDIRTYYVGETFDPTGLEFTLTYGNGTTETFMGSTQSAYDKLSYQKGMFGEAKVYTFAVSYTDDATSESVSCDLQITVKDPKAAKLEVNTVESDLKVVVGDDFKPDELFEVQYRKANTDETQKLSYDAGEYSVSGAPSTFTAAGMQTYTITKDGLTATVTVEVLPVFKSIEITGMESEAYFAGYPFSPGGNLKTVVTYNVGTLWTDAKKVNRWLNNGTIDTTFNTVTFKATEMTAANGFSWPTDKLLAGTKDITITFKDKFTGEKISKAVTITVKKLLDEMTVVIDPSVKFYAGDKFEDVFNANFASINVEISVNNGGPAFVPADLDKFSFSSSEELKKGNNQKITVSYTDSDCGETISCEVTFNVLATTYAWATGNPATDAKGTPKNKYSAGQTFDPSGLMWNVKKNGGAASVVTTGFTVYPDRPLTEADSSVVVTLGDLSYTYAITVSPRTMTKLAVTTNPDNMTYYVGQAFDPTGMIVTATYNNNTTQELKSGFTYPTAAFTEADIGTKTLTISYTDGAVTADTSIKLTITAAPTKVASLVLSSASLSLFAGQNTTLTATVYPTDASNKNVVWSSSDTKVATVNQAGVITPLQAGNCVITATSSDGSNRYADCFVTVKPKVAVTKLSLVTSTMELLVGDTTTLEATVAPANATYSGITWTTSDSSVVNITDEGKITGLKLGASVITAKADEKSVSMTINVVKELSKYGTVVNCSKRVNVRKSADGGSAQVGYANLGSTYKIIGESGNWYQIQYTDSTTAWIWKDYISVSSKHYVADSTTGTTTEGSTEYVISGSGSTGVYTKLTVVNCKRYVYVRKGPGTSYSKAGHAKPNETYKLLGVSGDWFQIDFGGNKYYINKSFAKLS